ncbi:MAG: MFS transporter [Isosphaeraceae bacterium]
MADLSTAPGSDPFEPPALAQRPTMVRYGVLAFLAAMSFILYLDRVCIAKAAPRMKEELKISDTRMGYIFAAFAISYALFEIPSGRWGDKYGSRGVLTRIVVWWTIFTALTGAAGGFLSLLAIQFFFGAGEAGALPNSARVLREWFPESTRGWAQGIVSMSMLIGAAVSPVAAQFLIDLVGWRWTFGVLGVLGVAWAITFYLWFRDDPATHHSVNEAEREIIQGGRKPASGEGDASPGDLQAHGPIPWPLVAKSTNIWLLGGAMVTMAGTYDLLITWYPTYLERARGASPDQSASLTSMVLAAGPFSCFFGGWLTDWLVRKTGNRRWGRTAQSVSGGALAALGILLSLMTSSTTLASVFVAVACFGIQLQVPAWWACATQVSGRHVGALFGLMNMMGSVGRVLNEVFLGTFADMMKDRGYTGRAQWDPGLFVYVFLALIGVALWMRVDPRRTVEDEDK